ncbi:MAG: radical SAM protein [Acidobacteriaceae bacterium]|nr:radical SAM protein [Acidobacteriaceae bacterium]
MDEFVKLVGIARAAAEGTLVAEKRRVDYRTLPTRKWLNRCHPKRVPFDWSINPYRGCEYGCKYCYARFTHEFLERRDPDLFETEIYAKDWNEAGFLNELKTVRPGHILGIGTATDPYQPAERRFGRTRKVLEALQALRGVSIFITTKSDLVSRDASLLKTLAGYNEVRVTLTVTTMNRDLARLTEPFAPRPDLRLHAVAELASAGVRVGVIASPVLPLITDSEDNLERVARAAKTAGADQFGANVLFLQPAAQRVFFAFLAGNFPRHLARYRRSYGQGAFLTGSYPERIREMVNDIRSRIGIPSRDMERTALPRPPGWELSGSQMMLF